jgi:hypothetical protein
MPTSPTRSSTPSASAFRGVRLTRADDTLVNNDSWFLPTPDPDRSDTHATTRNASDRLWQCYSLFSDWGGMMQTSRIIVAAFVATSLLVSCGSDDDSSGPTVLDLDGEVDGMDAAELLAMFNEALAEVPLDESMLIDPAKCDMGRSTEAVYFAPIWGAPGDSSTSCTMNADQALMLSPAGLLCIEGDGDKADMACLDENWDLTASSATIDGVDVTDLDGRLVDTEVFTADLPEGNVFEADPGPVDAIARGQVVLVEDLPVGSHTVVVAADFGDGAYAGALTINLTVEE